MDLAGLPQFTITEIRSGPTPTEITLEGTLSHLTGVRNTRGWIYRGGTTSLVGDLERVPTAPNQVAIFVTPDIDRAPELHVGNSYPWLDGYWQPYHLAMILAPPERWQRRTLAASPARYFALNGVTGWQPVGADLPAGAIDLGVKEGAWDHEHCELCHARIGPEDVPDGWVDPDDRWLCLDCHALYAIQHDVSFAAEA